MRELPAGEVVPGCGMRFHATSDAAIERLVTDDARDRHGLIEPRMPADVLALIRAATRPRSASTAFASVEIPAGGVDRS